MLGTARLNKFSFLVSHPGIVRYFLHTTSLVDLTFKGWGQHLALNLWQNLWIWYLRKVSNQYFQPLLVDILRIKLLGDERMKSATFRASILLNRYKKDHVIVFLILQGFKTQKQNFQIACFNWHIWKSQQILKVCIGMLFLGRLSQIYTVRLIRKMPFSFNEFFINIFHSLIVCPFMIKAWLTGQAEKSIIYLIFL